MPSLEKEAFMPVETKISGEAPLAENTIEEDADDSEEENEVEEIPAVTKIAYLTTDGSGDDSEPTVTQSTFYDEDEEYGNRFKIFLKNISINNNQKILDDEQSGSGGGPIPIIPVNVPVETPSPAPESDEEPEIIPTLGGLGIFEPELGSTKGPNLRTGQDNDETERVHEAIGGETHLPTSGVNKAAADDNNGTYVLLAILGIGLVSLIVFVAMKNHKSKKKNRHDIENIPATELQDMDKKLLGKPVEKNGNGNGQYEHIPLIDREKPEPHQFPSITTSSSY